MQQQITKTLDYYNSNAPFFYNKLMGADLSEICQRFLKKLPGKAHILDAGCGVGRDSKYFLGKGHKVTAFDGSREMVALACRETGLTVRHLLFQEMDFKEIFDGVWASASLLHVPYNEMRDVYQRIHKSLKPRGIFYASYKYGQDYMPTSDRDFWNMSESTILPYLEGLFDIMELTIENDIRKNSPTPDQKWLRFFAQKK